MALTDITELKRTEAALREARDTMEQTVRLRTAELDAANRRLNYLLGASPAVIYARKPGGDFDFTFVSKNVRKQLGYESRNFLDDPAFGMHRIHPEDKTGVTGSLARLTAWEAQNIEYRFLHKDGTYRWIRDDVRLMIGDATRPPEIVGSWTDITGRKSAEAALAAVTEEERARIARDLHDGLGQQLGSALFLCYLLQRDLQERGAAEGPRAAEVHSLIATAVAQAREVSRGLYPVSAEPDGLMTALQNLADRVSHDRRIECTFDADSAVLLHDATLATHLYRIAQEAVNNSLKHSGGGRVEIKLSTAARRVWLSVRDHGTGLGAAGRTAGLGIRSMNDRARLIGGRLLVENAKDGGVQVICSVRRTAPTANSATPAAQNKPAD
jgi:PAS domain S-box-containing protein